jgi:hypothetical protein
MEEKKYLISMRIDEKRKMGVKPGGDLPGND